jgi:heptosyltransferase-2
VLVIGPSWVGDMVMAQSLFMQLKQDVPERDLDVLAPAWSRALLARMPQVSGSLDLPFGHGELAIGERRRLGRRLRRAGYDQAIVLPNSFKSALVPWFAGIPRRTGWRGEWRYGLLNDLRILDRHKYPRMVQRFVALGKDAGLQHLESTPVPRLQVDPVESARCRRLFALAEDWPILALCPGAEFGSAKCWPSRHYGTLAGRYLERGWQVLLIGSDHDREVTRAVREACDRHPLCLDLAGQTTLAEAVDLLSLADAVVSNDSGLMHIAAALDRPLVAIFGATSPEFTPPLGKRVACESSAIECAPCFQRECPLGHHRCMVETSPGQVEEKLQTLLSGGD